MKGLWNSGGFWFEGAKTHFTMVPLCLTWKEVLVGFVTGVVFLSKVCALFLSFRLQWFKIAESGYKILTTTTHKTTEIRGDKEACYTKDVSLHRERKHKTFYTLTYTSCSLTSICFMHKDTSFK